LVRLRLRDCSLALGCLRIQLRLLSQQQKKGTREGPFLPPSVSSSNVHRARGSDKDRRPCPSRFDVPLMTRAWNGLTGGREGEDRVASRRVTSRRSVRRRLSNHLPPPSRRRPGSGVREIQPPPVKGADLARHVLHMSHHPPPDRSQRKRSVPLGWMDGWMDLLSSLPRVPLAVDEQGKMIERECVVLHPQHAASSRATRATTAAPASNSTQKQKKQQEGQPAVLAFLPSYLPTSILSFPPLLAATVNQRRRRRLETHTQNANPESPEGRVRVDPETTVSFSSFPIRGARWAFDLSVARAFFSVRVLSGCRWSHKSCRRSDNTRPNGPHAVASTHRAPSTKIGGACTALYNSQREDRYRRYRRRRRRRLVPGVRMCVCGLERT
jgi:hypothetical protein